MTKKNTSIGKAHEVRLMPKAKWGVHYHAIHPWTLEYHPQGAQTREDAKVLVAAKWRMQLNLIGTAPCWNGTDIDRCPILLAAMEKRLAEAWADFRRESE